MSPEDESVIKSLPYDNLVKAGQIALANKNLTLASLAFERALALAPKGVEAFAGLAEASLIRGNFKEAIDYAEKGLQQDKDNEKCLTAKAYALLREGRFAQLVSCLKTSKPASSLPVQHLVYLGIALAKLSMPDQAKEMFKRVSAKLLKGNIYCRVVLEPLMALGLGDEAQRLTERWVAGRPDMPEAFNALGRIYFEQATDKPSVDQELMDKAQECFRKALDLDSQYSDACFMLSLIAVAMDKTEEHEEYHRMFVELNSEQKLPANQG